MRWFLRFLVDEADRQAIEQDLAELYEFKRREYGERAAARWLRRQRLLYPVQLLFDRLRTIPDRWMATMLHLLKDVVYTVRSLARTPAMALTIVLTVGCALGATTGMLSVVRAVLASPLPYAAPDSLYWVYTDNPPYRFRFSVVDYRALEADHPAFSAIAAYQTSRVTVTDGGTAERVTAKSVTGSYFPLVGQAPHLGRLFDESDDARDNRGVVLTYWYWTQRFARDPNVVGRAISIDGGSPTSTSSRSPRAPANPRIGRPTLAMSMRGRISTRSVTQVDRRRLSYSKECHCSWS